MAKDNSKQASPKPKTKCPLSKEEFLDQAPKSLKANVGGVDLLVPIKVFKKESFGFYTNDKITLNIGEGEDATPVRFVISITITAVGSKPEEK